MSLAAILEKAGLSLAARWADAADAAYPFAAAGFFRTIQDPFANPVGQKSRALATLLLDAVIGKAHDGTALRAALEEFVRVRAVQDMPAERALQIMFAYKAIIRGYLKEHTIALTDALRADLDAVDERCETLALIAFGVYARSREALCELRLADMRRRNSQLLRLAKRHGLVIADEADVTPETNEQAQVVPGAPGSPGGPEQSG